MNRISTSLPLGAAQAALTALKKLRVKVAPSRLTDASIFASVLILAVVVALMAVDLGKRATSHHRAVTLNALLQMQAYRQNALEWQAIAKGKASSEIAHERQDAVTVMWSLLTDLSRMDKGT